MTTNVHVECPTCHGKGYDDPGDPETGDTWLGHVCDHCQGRKTVSVPLIDAKFSGREFPVNETAPTNARGYTAGLAEWLDPLEVPPPRGSKILLLTAGGVCVIGHWCEWMVAWHPLPRVPAVIRERLQR